MHTQTVVISLIALVVGAYVAVKIPTVHAWVAKLP